MILGFPIQLYLNFFISSELSTPAPRLNSDLTLTLSLTPTYTLSIAEDGSLSLLSHVKYCFKQW